MVGKSDSKEAEALYASLGKALNRWAGVEQTLSSVYCNCVNPDNAWPAIRTFWAVVAFEAKLEMTSEAVRGKFYHLPAMVGKWEKIREILKRKASLRNKLAHGLVVRMTNYRHGSHKPDLFLSPYHWKVTSQKIFSHKEMQHPRYDARPKDRLYRKNIDEITSQFREIDGKVMAFLREMRTLEQREGNLPPEA
jgi:hypothetical protein